MRQGPFDIEKAISRACKAAARTIEQLGCQESIPWKDELMASTEQASVIEPNISTTAQQELVNAMQVSHIVAEAPKDSGVPVINGVNHLTPQPLGDP